MLVSPFGVIPSRGRAKDLSAGLGDPRYRCALLAVDSFRSFDLGQQRDALACLESLILLDRAFAEGFSFLAILYEYKWVYGLGPEADDAALLDRALHLAQRGIELMPNNARAWQALAGILIERRDFEPGLDAFRTAMALNPLDPVIVDGYGGRLITLGEIERGMAVLQQSKCPSDKRPSWHHFYLFLSNYILGKLPEATHEADTMTSNSYPHGLFARALTAALKGDNDKAQSTWAALVALRSAWHDNPRAELERFIFAPAIVDRLISDLARTGLYTPK